MRVEFISLTPFVMLFVALVKAADRKLVTQLRAAGAVSPARAIAVEVPQLMGSMRLRRMVSAGAIHATPDQRFFLDEAGLARLTRTRRLRALGIIAGVLLILAVLWWAGTVRF